MTLHNVLYRPYFQLYGELMLDEISVRCSSLSSSHVPLATIGLDENVGVRCAFFDRDLHLRKPVRFTPLLRLKRCAMRVTNGIPVGCPLPLTGWHCKLRCTTLKALDMSGAGQAVPSPLTMNLSSLR